MKVDDSAAGYPVRRVERCAGRGLYRAGGAGCVRDVSSGGWEDDQAVAGPGRGQALEFAPGNLYSKPRKVHVGPGGQPIAISLDQVIPPIVPEADTKYVRHIRIQSALLTKFWGTPTYLSAIVLVPEGFDEHPQAQFPLMIFHDHFVSGFDDFRTTPPDPNLKPNYSERFHLEGYNRIQQEEAYKEYQQWIKPEVSAGAGDEDSACESVL